MLTRIKSIWTVLPRAIGMALVGVFLTAFLSGSSCHVSSCHHKHHHGDDHHCGHHHHLTSDSWSSADRTTRRAAATAQPEGVSEPEGASESASGSADDGSGAGAASHLADPSAYRLRAFTLVAGKAGKSPPVRALVDIRGVSLLDFGNEGLFTTEVLRRVTERLLLANPHLFGSVSPEELGFAGARFHADAIEVRHGQREAGSVLFVFDLAGNLTRVGITGPGETESGAAGSQGT